MSTYHISEWLFFFYIYCFLGWVWESCYVSLHEGRLVNRGFMKGPMLPIYGSGAVGVLLVTLPFRGNYLLMAVVGMGAATLLEYVTGAAMEALFKVRYWDYTGKFLNLNGYICIGSTLCWGFMTFLVVYGIHPLVVDAVEQLPEKMILMSDYLLTALAGADFATSFKAAIDFRDILLKVQKAKEELKNIQKRLDELEGLLAEKAGSFIDNSMKNREEKQELNALRKEQLLKEREELSLSKGIKTEGLRSSVSKSIRGLMKRNPGVASRKYSEAMNTLKTMAKEKLPWM